METQRWIGKSGRVYTFGIIPLSQHLNPGLQGVFILAQKARNTWLPLRVESSDDLERRLDDYRHDSSLDPGTTYYIHVFKTTDKLMRRHMEQEFVG